MVNYDEKVFNVDFKGWSKRIRRSFSDVKLILSEEGEKKFEEFAKSALYGDEIVIDGIFIMCVPDLWEIRKRCRYYIEI